MTDEAAVKLAERVEEWQQRLSLLGIGHWDIACVTLTDDVPGREGSRAAVQVDHDYDQVHFYFLNDFVENAAQRQLDETIVHEWMHAVMRDIDACFEWVAETLSPAAADAFNDRVDHDRERLVDNLARLVVAIYNED